MRVMESGGMCEFEGDIKFTHCIVSYSSVGPLFCAYISYDL